MLFLGGGGILVLGFAFLARPTAFLDLRGGDTPGAGLIWLGLSIVLLYLGQGLVALGLFVPGEGRIPYLRPPAFDHRRRLVPGGLAVIPPLEALFVASGAFVAVGGAPVVWAVVVTAPLTPRRSRSGHGVEC